MEEREKERMGEWIICFEELYHLDLRSTLDDNNTCLKIDG